MALVAGFLVFFGLMWIGMAINDLSSAMRDVATAIKYPSE